MAEKKMKEMLALKSRLKRKKPSFLRQDAHKRKKLAQNWRRPRGWQSKIRLVRKGYRKPVEIGYGSPRAVKGMTSYGMVPVVVSAVDELSSLDKGRECVVVSSRVGDRKRLAIIEEAGKLGIKVHNHDAEKRVSAIKEDVESRKKRKQELEKKAKAKEEEKEKKKSIEETVKEEISEEEKKKAEKEEKDKVLTRKDGI